MGDIGSFGPARLSPAMGSRALLVLAFVREYIARWGQAPSQREIANGLDVSRSAVCKALRRLEADGLIARGRGERGIALADELAAARAVLARAGYKIGGPNEPLAGPPELDYPCPPPRQRENRA